MAYNNHDIDDGLRSGLVTVGADAGRCASLPAITTRWSRTIPMSPRRMIAETIRRMINTLIVGPDHHHGGADRAASARKRGRRYARPRRWWDFSEEIRGEADELKASCSKTCTGISA